MLQIGFAENYMTIWQDKIQSSHWQKKQITVFTSVYWNGLQHQSSVNISDTVANAPVSVTADINIKVYTGNIKAAAQETYRYSCIYFNTSNVSNELVFMWRIEKNHSI